jgi:hypothetical protein
MCKTAQARPYERKFASGTLLNVPIVALVIGRIHITDALLFVKKGLVE